jgi:hypothetical protein
LRLYPCLQVLYVRVALTLLDGEARGYAGTMTDCDAVFQGGPCDGMTHAAAGAGLVEIQIDGMVHRYIPTGRRGPEPGAELTVYTYDGMVVPARAATGAGHPEVGPAPDRDTATGHDSGPAEP